MKFGKSVESPTNDSVNTTTSSDHHEHHHPRRIKRVNSVYSALNHLGTSMQNIFENVIHHRHRKRSSQSLTNLHLATANSSEQIPKIEEDDPITITASNSDSREVHFSPSNQYFKPSPTISEISEGPLSSENEEMEHVHWQDISSLESHSPENSQHEEASIPSIPKRKHSNQKKTGERSGSMQSGNWIESVTAELESLQPPSQSSGVGESIDEDGGREEDSECCGKPTKQKTLRKTISFQTTSGDDDDTDSEDEDISPKNRFLRTARKNSMAPHKAFSRTKSAEPQ